MKGRIWIWNILALICLTACDRWFDVNPQTEVKQKELFSTDQGFYNALMGVYLNLSDPELYGGELQFGLVDVLAQTYSISNTTGGGRPICMRSVMIGTIVKLCSNLFGKKLILRLRIVIIY